MHEYGRYKPQHRDNMEENFARRFASWRQPPLDFEPAECNPGLDKVRSLDFNRSSSTKVLGLQYSTSFRQPRLWLTPGT